MDNATILKIADKIKQHMAACHTCRRAKRNAQFCAIGKQHLESALLEIDEPNQPPDLSGVKWRYQ